MAGVAALPNWLRACMRRFAHGQLIEVNAHSLFSKWFSESGKLVARLFDKILELVRRLHARPAQAPGTGTCTPEDAASLSCTQHCLHAGSVSLCVSVRERAADMAQDQLSFSQLALAAWL